MSAFGISFPKLTLFRSSTSKNTANNVSSTTKSTTNGQTLSLSIKSVPSQPLHYDISTTSVKSKPSTFTTILAIDGETKRLPKTLSVFNELRIDDGTENNDDRKRREDSSCDIVIVSPSLTPLDAIGGSKTKAVDRKDADKKPIQDSRSDNTFTPPTSSTSNESSVNILHLTTSTISIDLPQLKYATEHLLSCGDDDNPLYEVAEEFPSNRPIYDENPIDHGYEPDEIESELKQHVSIITTNVEFQPIEKTNDNLEVSSQLPAISTSNDTKRYISELRIDRSLVYRTHWTNKPQREYNRKLSHSVNDLKQICNFTNNSEIDRYSTLIRETGDDACLTLPQQYVNTQQQRRHQSDDNILLNSQLSLSSTDNDLSELHSVADRQHLTPLVTQRTLDRSLGRDDTLIRNESVKKKLFDILNDDELENACLEDMTEELESLSIVHHQGHHHVFPIVNAFSLSDDDDEILYSSPPNELHLLPLLSTPPLSSSYNENLSTQIDHATDVYFSRSRLITSSLDKIPINHNAQHNHKSSSCLSRPSYEDAPPSWHTSPSPQWRMDDQLTIASVLEKHSSRNHDYLNGINSTDSNRLYPTKVIGYDIEEHKSVEDNDYQTTHRREQMHKAFPLLNTSPSLTDDSTTTIPIIRDNSTNVLMFI